MEASNEINAVDILSWIFDELDTQKFGIKNNKHFNYFDDSEDNVQKINHFYLNLKPFTDLSLNVKHGEDIDGESGLGESSGRHTNANKDKNELNKNRPNQGDTGDFNELWRSRFQSVHKTEVEVKVEENEDGINEDNTDLAFLDLESSMENDETKEKNLNFEGFNPNLSLNPDENRLLLRKYKSDIKIDSKKVNNIANSKKIARSLSTSVLIPPVLVHINSKFTNFNREKPNTFFNSSNRSLFNSTVLSDEDILTEFPDNKLEKNEIIEEDLIEENKDELINNNKINKSIRNTDLILEEIMDNSKISASTTVVNTNVTNSKEDIIKMSLDTVMTKNSISTSQDDLSLLERDKNEKASMSAYTLNEYGQSLFRLRYYLLQLKYLIDCHKDLEQIVFYKLALSQYPDSNSVRTWLKRRVTREPLVHGYCLPPFTMNDEGLTNDLFSRPLKKKIFHSLSLDKKYQVIEPLSFEFNRKVMGTSEHKSLVTCNNNLKYCQMRQRSDIVLRTIFIKHLFQQAPAVKRLVGNERFQSLKDKALLNLQPRASKHVKPKENISNSMISIKLKTNKKNGIFLQHHSKKSSIDFTSRNSRSNIPNMLPPQPVDTINNNLNSKGLHSSTFNRRIEKSLSFQNIFSSNSPSKLRNCHMLEPTPTHKYSYSQPLSHIIFNKQNNQYSIETSPNGSSPQRFFNKEKTFFSKYLFSNNNYGNINNYSFHNATNSNSNMMLNKNNSNNSNNVIVISNVNGMSANNVNNNINSNMTRNNRNMVKSDMSLNNNNNPVISGQLSKSNNNINNNINPYNYRKQHRHISSISSVKDINNDMNTCYNLSTLKNTIENVSKAKLNNNLRNLNITSPSVDQSNHDQCNCNSNRKLQEIQSEKSLKSFEDSDKDSVIENFNQSDVINNYSDQDSVYSLSSNYGIDKSSIEKDNSIDAQNDDFLNSNRTLVNEKENKKSIFKKIAGIVKSKKHTSKNKNKDKNVGLKLTPKEIKKSQNIEDSDETINNSMEIARLRPNTLTSNSNFSINNSNFSVNNSNFSVNNSNFSMNKNYNSNETIHTNSRSINPINKNANIIIEKNGNVNVKKSTSKWHIHIFGKNTNKTKVRN